MKTTDLDISGCVPTWEQVPAVLLCLLSDFVMALQRYGQPKWTIRERTGMNIARFKVWKTQNSDVQSNQGPRRT
jgi:hypothetical protein